MTNQTNSIPKVDLVIVIDTSASMRDEAQALSDAAEAAIDSAKSSCPSDLRVIWFGVEGIWKGTNFNQTIREYLTQTCKVPESNLRGRKKEEITGSGAQEDGARAIEDISSYFDWRAGAARAIFYLSDEALEGGGPGTNKKDIEAANQAIAKAQEAGVTIHTYLGTTSSVKNYAKRRESLAQEYTRVASETGGQAFNSEEGIGTFSEVLEKVICGSRTFKPAQPTGKIYIQDCVEGEVSNLYTLDLNTGKADLVGAIATEVADIAFVGSELYGLDQINKFLRGQTTQLLKIDPASGKPEVIGDIGFPVVGLAYNSQTNTLYTNSAKQLISINLETGKGTPVVTVANEDLNCGEVTFDANGTAYITLIGYDKKKFLATCNLDTGEVVTIGDIGFPDLASMEFLGNTLYGVTGNFFNLGKDGQLIIIDTNTGAGTLVKMTEPSGRWAGITLLRPKQ